MKPVFLIGYMGSGKTTLGRNVSALSGLEFIDLDRYIEKEQGMTIRDIFIARGDDGFRQIERDALHAMSGRRNVIIACGGGTPCFYDNMEWMNSNGMTVRLDTGFDKLLSRLKRGRHKRPLLADKDDEQLAEFIRAGLRERAPWYNMAQVSFVSDLLETEAEATTTAERFIRQVLKYD